MLQRRMPYLCSSPTNAITQYADSSYFHFDDVPLLQKTVQFQPGTTGRCTGPEYLAGIQRLRLRCIGDHGGKGMMHVRRGILSSHFTINAYRHAQVTRVQLVGTDNTRPQHVRAIPVFGFAWSHIDWQLARLYIVSRDIVPDSVAKDVTYRVLSDYIFAASANDCGKF